jgi:hypothetical protein
LIWRSFKTWIIHLLIIQVPVLLGGYRSKNWILSRPSLFLTSVYSLIKLKILLRVVVCIVFTPHDYFIIILVFSVGSLFYFAIINDESNQEDKYKDWTSDHELNGTEKRCSICFRFFVFLSDFIIRVYWSNTDLIIVLIKIFIWSLIKNHIVLIHEYTSEYPYVIVSEL